MSKQRAIPLRIKREVRQRCGFGCVICGKILYEYDHLVPWAKIKKHEADKLTLLCPDHHAEKTRGRLPDEKIHAANANPYNHRKGVSKRRKLYYDGKECEIIMGGNRFADEDQEPFTKITPLIIDNMPLISFSINNGQLFLDLKIFDETSALILEVTENELVYSVSSWDIQYEGSNLKIHAARRKTLVEIVFAPPNKVTVVRAPFMFNGVEVLVRPENILVVNRPTIYKGCEFTGTHGLAIGKVNDLQGGKIRIGCYFGDVPRHIKDRSETLAWERSMVQKTRKLDNT
jgi:hypothetical protein